MKRVLQKAMLAGVALLLASAADARASGPQCGEVITTDVVLQTDLLECPGDGLVAAGLDVSIDLNYHRIDGSGSGVGIRVLASEVTVRNGLLTDFEDGVKIEPEGLADAWLADLDVSSNSRNGIVVAGPLGMGSGGGGQVTILSSYVHHNGGAGIRESWTGHAMRISDSTIGANGVGVVFDHAPGGTVFRNRILDNANSGVSFNFAGGGRVDRNAIDGNGIWGVGANRSSALVVVDNSVTRNGTPGAFSGGAFFLEGLTTVERNTFNRNLGHGLVLDEFLETRSRWPINFNTANRNTGYGILAAQPGFTGSGNVAKHNGEPSQCLNFPCK